MLKILRVYTSDEQENEKLVVIPGASVVLRVEADVSEILLAFPCGCRMAAASLFKAGKGEERDNSQIFLLFSTWLPKPCFSSL